jgi:hypothetical protein
LKKSFGSNEYWQIRDKIDTIRANLEYVELKPKAKLTDFVEFSPCFYNCPFLISGRVRNVFLNHHLQKHDVFRAAIVDKDKRYDYWLYHFPRMNDDIYNYSKSTFSVYGRRLSDKDLYSFESAERKRNSPKDNYGLGPDTAWLNEKFDSNLDLFALETGQIIISEKLKISLERLKVTGVNILLSSDVNATWLKAFLPD